MSGQELTEREQLEHVLNPSTGEIVTVRDATTDQLAEYLASVREFESLLREHKQAVTGEVLRRMDQEARWSVTVGDHKLSSRSPEPVIEYDGERLHAALQQLVAEDLIAPAAADAACERVVTYKPVKRGINALLKLGVAVTAVIEACGREEHPERRVSVRPA
jgi:hypothetical protein